MLKSGKWKIGLAGLVVVVALFLWLVGDRKLGEKGEVEHAAVTKPYPRERDEKMERQTKNPREEFEAARKRGMTEEEVRWVVEEFMESGIKRIDALGVSEQELREVREKQQRWYLATLVEGFGLTAKQKKQAESRMREMLERDIAAFRQLTGEEEGLDEAGFKEVYGLNNNPFEKTPAGLLSNPDFWISSGELYLWMLCEPNDMQKEMVRYMGEDGEWIWIVNGSTKDYGTDERYELFDFFADDHYDLLMKAGTGFPLSMEQVDLIRALSGSQEKLNSEGVVYPSVLEQVKFLTAPQLRTLLLFRPEMAGELMKELGE